MTTLEELLYLAYLRGRRDGVQAAERLLHRNIEAHQDELSERTRSHGTPENVLDIGVAGKPRFVAEARCAASAEARPDSWPEAGTAPIPIDGTEVAQDETPAAAYARWVRLLDELQASEMDRPEEFAELLARGNRYILRR